MVCDKIIYKENGGVDSNHFVNELSSDANKGDNLYWYIMCFGLFNRCTAITLFEWIFEYFEQQKEKNNNNTNGTERDHKSKTELFNCEKYLSTNVRKKSLLWSG